MPRFRALVLGSSSPFRRALLDRLAIPYEVDSPDIDESAHPNESPEELVARLSRDKALAVLARHGDALVIGSDQVAVIDGEVMGKPGNHLNATRQLRRASGGEVRFLTGLCLADGRTGALDETLVPVRVGFRSLDDATIDAYLRRDQPWGCAGSIRAEGAGVALLRFIRTDDPTALIGLPLIALCRMLEAAGCNILDPH